MNLRKIARGGAIFFAVAYQIDEATNLFDRKSKLPATPDEGEAP